MLDTQVYLPEISFHFARFKELIGEEFWIKRVQSINDEIRGFPFLEDYLVEENSITYALFVFSGLMNVHGIIPRRQRQNTSLYDAFAFVVQVLSFIDQTPLSQKPRFIRRVQGAFNNPDDLRALRFEFTVATHFIQRGKDVSWPEVGESGSHDLLIENVGVNGLEIECKSISNDKGRRIHGREALEFLNLVRSQIMEYIENNELLGGTAIVVTLPERVPKSLKERQAVISKIMNTVSTKTSQTYPNNIDIKLSNFDLSRLSGIDIHNKNKHLRQLLDELTLTDNREAMVFGTKKKAVVVVLQTTKQDTLLKYMFDTLSKSAKKQLTKSRPAIYMVELSSVNAEELKSIANQDFDPEQKPTGLNIAVHQFLSSKSRDHIVGVGFLSNGEIEQADDGIFSGSGTAYFFPKKTSKYWHEDFTGMFS